MPAPKVYDCNVTRGELSRAHGAARAAVQRVAQRSKNSTYRAARSVTGPARQEQQRGGSGRAHGLPNFNFWRWSSQNEWRVLLIPNSASQERRPDRSALHAQLVAAVSRCWSAALSTLELFGLRICPTATCGAPWAGFLSHLSHRGKRTLCGH